MRGAFREGGFVCSGPHRRLLLLALAVPSLIVPVFAALFLGRRTQQLPALGQRADRSNASQGLCHRALVLTLETCVQPFTDNTTFVLTGDIEAMWIRDSAAQLKPYIFVAQHEGPGSRLWPILHGALRSQAKFILTDPYANAFTRKWDSAFDDRLQRGAYVFTGNYELDSGAYFFALLAQLAEASPQAAVLREAPVRDAVALMLRLYRTEQRHAYGASRYRYPKSFPWELPGRDGRGHPVAYTGMVWGAFRPSDDAQWLGYHVASNVFLAAMLGKVATLAEALWADPKLADRARQLRAGIVDGVRRFGTRKWSGQEVYCYEVDGLGNCSMMDDANIPSLLSLPYLDPLYETFDRATYLRTRAWILSDHNPWFFHGPESRGIGSPHTGIDQIWPLAQVMEAMTAESKEEKAEALRRVLLLNFTTGLPESFNKADRKILTRAWFGWPNALLAEHLLSLGCCLLSLQDVRFPPVRDPPRSRQRARHGYSSTPQPPFDFYHADVELLRRKDVVLPEEDRILFHAP